MTRRRVSLRLPRASTSRRASRRPGRTAATGATRGRRWCATSRSRRGADDDSATRSTPPSTLPPPPSIAGSAGSSAGRRATTTWRRRCRRTPSAPERAGAGAASLGRHACDGRSSRPATGCARWSSGSSQMHDWRCDDCAPTSTTPRATTTRCPRRGAACGNMAPRCLLLGLIWDARSVLSSVESSEWVITRDPRRLSAGVTFTPLQPAHGQRPTV
mmetsp:Transcript_26597/g.106520  ORF Transcript_26597/g.106520 Transcript_26597/m.106520 type:complete len:216 (-) Transcript_26597:129-776(-)